MGASSPSPRASGARQRLMRVPRPPVWYTHGHVCVNVGVGVVVGVCACRAQWEGLSGCVIVFDVTDRASFMACSKWLSLVRQRLSPGTKPGSIVLVGNRVDLNTRRSVDRQEALDWANDEGIDFCETSAVRGRRGAPTRNRVVDAHPPRARAAGALSAEFVEVLLPMRIARIRPPPLGEPRAVLRRTTVSARTYESQSAHLKGTQLTGDVSSLPAPKTVGMSFC